MSGIQMALLGSVSTAASATIYLADEYVQVVTGGVDPATAGYRLLSTGVAQVTVGTTYTTIYSWCTPGSAAGDYEAFVTVLSGSLSSGISGAWVALSSSQTWTRLANIGSLQVCEFTVQIRQTGTTTVLASATITLEADATF